MKSLRLRMNVIFLHADLLTRLQSGGQFEIGGDSNRWLNITRVNNAQGHDADHVNYTCQVCVNQGILPLEECHNATVTLYLPGASTISDDKQSSGTFICINN